MLGVEPLELSSALWHRTVKPVTAAKTWELFQHSAMELELWPVRISLLSSLHSEARATS